MCLQLSLMPTLRLCVTAGVLTLQLISHQRAVGPLYATGGSVLDKPTISVPGIDKR